MGRRSPAAAPPVIALLGAESTGKSTLTHDLAAALQAEGLVVGQVDEYLREFCVQTGRTPLPGEQAGIAAEQTRRIAAARTARLPPPDTVIADTTALMTAVYSDLIFGDTTLYAQALADHRQADLTLLMALDLPWVADPLRDGPQVQQPVDRLLRTALIGAGIPFAVISGSGPQRLAAALAARAAWQRRIEGSTVPARAWQHVCGRCGDPACERHFFTG